MFFNFQIENRALRLRETFTAAQLIEDLSPSTPPSHQLPLMPNVPDSSPRMTFDYFDEIGYVQRGSLKTGEDPYVRNRFNQQASDALSSNRNIPDTRNAM